MKNERLIGALSIRYSVVRDPGGDRGMFDLFEYPVFTLLLLYRKFYEKLLQLVNEKTPHAYIIMLNQFARTAPNGFK